MKTDNNTETATDEPGSDLAHLIAEAEGIEGAEEAKQAEAQQAQDEQQIEDSRQALRDALGMARMVAAPAMAWWVDYAACWSDKQLDAISDAGAQVMQRHGITMGELFSQYGPYIALAGATLPPGLATYAAIKARKADAEAERQRPAVQPVAPDTAQQGVRL